MAVNPRRAKKLVILDLDDLLVKRHRKTATEDVTQLMAKLSLENGERQITAFPHFALELRPGLQGFFKVLFKRCQVGIWTSATNGNANAIVDTIFTKEQRGKLLFVWCRNQCALDPSYDPNNPNGEIKDYSTIKPFTRILESPAINEQRAWNQTNVLIIDNSELKLRFNPESTKLVWPDFDRDLIDVFEHPFFSS